MQLSCSFELLVLTKKSADTYESSGVLQRWILMVTVLFSGKKKLCFKLIINLGKLLRFKVYMN